VPAAAVAAVALTALATAWFSMKPQQADDPRGRPERPLDAPVVRAPPLEQAPATTVLGGASACRQCGTVEAVAAQDNSTRFELRVRMDDGTVQTLQQAVPATAGARVVVRNGVARPAPTSASQG
jgi:hypothetical protein